MPEAVRAEISPGFIEKKTFQEEIPEKINKLNTNAKFTNSNLKVIFYKSAFYINNRLWQDQQKNIIFVIILVPLRRTLCAQSTNRNGDNFYLNPGAEIC